MLRRFSRSTRAWGTKNDGARAPVRGRRVLQPVTVCRLFGRVRHRVLDDLDEDFLDRLPAACVAQDHGDRGVQVECLPDVLDGVTGSALEAVDAHHEGDGAPLEVVDRREAVLQAAGVGEHDRAQGAGRQLVPQEPEAVLAGGAEQVQHEVLAQRDAAEVHGDRGGVLALHAAGVVDRTARLRQQFLGAQRLDLADGADQGGLADTEAARHEDLESDGLDRGLAAFSAPEDHRSLLSLLAQVVSRCRCGDTRFTGPAGR